MPFDKNNPKARKRRKVCQFCEQKATFVDYKDTATLRHYLSERGKILPRRTTGAYSVDEVIYVYFFNNGQSYRITPERELAQLLGASEGYVIWMDVTTRQRDVLKIAKIPVD